MIKINITATIFYQMLLIDLVANKTLFIKYAELLFKFILNNINLHKKLLA